MHTGSLNDAVGENLTWEAVYAHEMGHAENFFSSQLSYIRSTLSRFNIDDGTRSLSQIVSLIRQVIMSADVLYSEASNISANRATELWYATQPRWHLIESDGLIKKWVKE